MKAFNAEAVTYTPGILVLFHLFVLPPQSTWCTKMLLSSTQEVELARKALLQIDWASPYESSTFFSTLVTGGAESVSESLGTPSVSILRSLCKELMRVSADKNRTTSLNASATIPSVSSFLLTTSSYTSAPFGAQASTLMLADAVREAFHCLECTAHPVLQGIRCEAESSLQPSEISKLTARTRWNTSTALDSEASQGGAVICCPLCLACACEDFDFIKAFLSISVNAAAHSSLACRTAVLSGLPIVTQVLAEVAMMKRADHLADATHTLLTFYSFFLKQFHLLTSSLQCLISPSTTTSAGGNFESDDVGSRADSPKLDDGKLQRSLTALCEGVIVDGKERSVAVSVLLNTPIVFLKEHGTLLHFCSRHRLHCSLRWLLGFTAETWSLGGNARTHSPTTRKSHTSALRFDSLNRMDQSGSTPLSIALSLDDHTTARLLLLHGASIHAEAKFDRNGVKTFPAVELVSMHRCSQEMESMFVAWSPAPNPSKSDGISAGVAAGTPIPRFELTLETLQLTMQNALSRSTVSALLLDVAQKLARHIREARRQQLAKGGNEESAVLRHPPHDTMDPALRTALAAAQADPWSNGALKELSDYCLDCIHLLKSGGAESSAANQQVLKTLDMLRCYCDSLSTGAAAQHHASNVNPVKSGVSDRSTPSIVPWNQKHRTQRAQTTDSLASHPSLHTANVLVGDDGCVHHVRVVFHCENSGEHFFLWVRLSALLGGMLPTEVPSAEELHGVVEAEPSPLCPIRSGDLVIFRLDGGHFRAVNVEREGTVRVRGLNGCSFVIRKLSVGEWSRPEDDPLNPDATVWMEKKSKLSVIDELSGATGEIEPWRRWRQAIVGRRRGVTLWAVQLDQRCGDRLWDSLCEDLGCVLSEPLVVSRDTCDPRLPWTCPGVLLITGRAHNTVIGICFPEVAAS